MSERARVVAATVGLVLVMAAAFVLLAHEQRAIGRWSGEAVMGNVSHGVGK